MMNPQVWLVDNCIDPIGEAKTDYEVSLEIAKKLSPELVEKYTWAGRLGTRCSMPGTLAT